MTTDFTLTTTVAGGYDDTVARVREGLAEAGFGVLTEIDMKATLKKKIDVDIAPKIILGACRPQLAHRAIEVDPRIAVLLPCNVVVTSLDDDTTRVEVFDPDFMATVANDPELEKVACDARERLVGMLDQLEGNKGGGPGAAGA